MEKPEVKVVYWNHGRYSSDLQDQVFDQVIPEFFEAGAWNILGIEDGGNYTDSERNRKMSVVLEKPHAIESYMAAPEGYGPEDVMGLIVSYVFQILNIRGNGSLLGRERMMLWKWNRENPRRMALPLIESFRDEQDRQRVSASTDELAVTRRMISKDGKFSKGDLIREVGRMEAIYSKGIAERNANWIRVIRDFIEMTAVANPVRLKILLTIGSDHFELTENLRSELGDRIIIMDDLVLRPGGDDEDGRSGKKKSEEKILRDLLYKTMRSSFVLLGPQEPSSFYGVNEDSLKGLARYVDELSMQELCDRLGVRMDDVLSADGKMFEDEPNNETTLERLREEFGEFDDVGLLIDRSGHPNNIFMDVVFVTAVVSTILGINREGDEFNLLAGAIESIRPDKLPAVRKEAYEYVRILIEEQRSSDSLPLIILLLAFIARQDPSNSELWGENSGKLKGVQSLVGRVRALFS